MNSRDVWQELTALKNLVDQQQHHINSLHEQLEKDSKTISSITENFRAFEADHSLKDSIESIKDEVCSITFLMFYALLHTLQRDEGLRQALYKAASKDLSKKGDAHPYVIRGLRQLVEFTRTSPVMEVRKTPAVEPRKNLSWTPQVIKGGKERDRG